jgi:hypothetical protein
VATPWRTSHEPPRAKLKDHPDYQPVGLIAHRNIRSLSVFAFLFLFAGFGIFVRQLSHAATQTPEIAVMSYNEAYCLDDFQGKLGITGSPAKVDDWPCNGTGPQQWSKQGSYIKIQGQCLDIDKAGTANGTPVDLYPCNDGTNQQWRYSNNSGEDTEIISMQSEKCLMAGDPPAKDQLYITTCNSAVPDMLWSNAVYIAASTPTPAPATPIPTVHPTSAPATTPVPFPTRTPFPGDSATPVPTADSNSGAGGIDPTDSGSGTDTSAAIPDAPANFTASISGNNSVIDLSWLASTSVAGVSDYELDRSLDQTNWTVLSTGISDTSYTDSTVDYGVTYYYRVSATDNNGNASAYSYANATTPSFSSNVSSDASSPTTLNSEDGVATVSVPANATSGSADCSIATSSYTGAGPKSNYKLVAGPYQVVCKDQTGNQIDSFSAPISWTLNLKNKLKGYTGPAAYSADSTGKLSSISGQNYKTVSSQMTFQTSSPNPVMVFATTAAPFPWSALALVLIIIGAVVGVGALILKRQQKFNFNDYVRHKYYNL